MYIHTLKCLLNIRVCDGIAPYEPNTYADTSNIDESITLH